MGDNELKEEDKRFMRGIAYTLTSTILISIIVIIVSLVINIWFDGYPTVKICQTFFFIGAGAYLLVQPFDPEDLK